MKKFNFLKASLLLLLFSSCDKEERIAPSEQVQEDPQALTYYPTKSNVNQDLKIVSFNTHEEDKSHLEQFRDNYLTSDVQVLCLQEVKNIQDVKDVFKVYDENGGGFPYYKYVRNYTKLVWVSGSMMSPPWPIVKENHVVILSKLPIVEVDTKFIQKDPAVDEWSRHAVYTRIKVNETTSIDVFGYHNTYNFHNNSSQYEKSGVTKFKNWVESKVGPLSSANNVFLVGDLNLPYFNTRSILGSSLNYAYNWVDYVISTSSINQSGHYNTAPAISDHDAPYARFNLNTNLGQALNNVVRLYEHSNFGGAIASFELGMSPDIRNLHGSWWNDRASSVKAGSKVQFAGYEHTRYRGTTYYWPPVNNSGTLSSLKMNDKISSTLVVYR